MLRKIVGSFLLVMSSNLFADCVITGCNGEICADSAIPKAGLCIWKPEYHCYQEFGICEADADGNCAWKETTELQECFRDLEQRLEGNEP